MRNKTGQRILIANSVSSFANSAIMESFLGEVLDARGCNVAYLLCDGVLDGCLNCKFSNIKNVDLLLDKSWKNENSGCLRCFKNHRKYFENDITKFHFSEYLTNEEKIKLNEIVDNSPNIQDMTYSDIGVFEHAYSATARFFAKGAPEDEDQFEDVLRIFAKSSIATIIVIENIINKFKPEVIVGHHGIYVPQGPIVDVAKKHGIRVVTWTPSYRKGTFIFAEGDTYHKVLPSVKLTKGHLSAAEKKEIVSYLSSRRHGENDWIWYNKSAEPVLFPRELYKIARDKKIITAFTNVFWDAQLHFENSIFKNMVQWLEKTIEFVKLRKDVHLLIRVHPAEQNGFIPSRQPIEALIQPYLDGVSNVTIIPPTDPTSSYDIAVGSEFNIVFGTKMAAEISGLGKRVIVAGEAWARGKGFTDDALSTEHYFDLLRKNIEIDGDLDQEKHELALRYCYQFFFETMTDFEFVTHTGKKEQPFKLKKYHKKDLIMTKFDGFEKIIETILGRRKTSPMNAKINEKILSELPSYKSEILLTKNDINNSSEIVNRLGLQSHHDRQKNWDTLKSLSGIIQNSNPCDNLSILDIGTGSKPTILKWLRAVLPESQLWGCDREASLNASIKEMNINFCAKDITEANFGCEQFNFVTCISVIEHGVDTKLLFKEISRVLKKNGLAFISTDYWDTGIDTSGKFPYGLQYGEMKVFSQKELEALISEAKEEGLLLIGDNVDLSCNEKAVYWERMDEKYTFAFLCFEKVST